MAREISNEWKERMNEQIQAKAPISEILSYKPAIKWLITELARVSIASRVIPIGGAVFMVTTETDTCPKCGGLGRI